MARKKSRNFFLSKSKVYENKNVYVYYFYYILRFYKYWFKSLEDIKINFMQKILLENL